MTTHDWGPCEPLELYEHSVEQEVCFRCGKVRPGDCSTALKGLYAINQEDTCDDELVRRIMTS